MKIVPEDLIQDESKSTPMAVAISHPKCPMSRPCFWIVAGSGAIAEQCANLKSEGETASCLWKGDAGEKE